MEEADGVKIMHGRNGREYKLSELPCFSVDGSCPETRTFYEFFGCYFYRHTLQAFRDVSIMIGVTLAECNERKVSRLEQITRGGYLVNFNGNVSLMKLV